MELSYGIAFTIHARIISFLTPGGQRLFNFRVGNC